MKSIKITSISLLACLLLFNSCKKFYDKKINNSPTALDYPEPSVLLPTAIANLSYYYGGDISRIPAVLTQQATGTSNQWAAYDGYQFADADFGNAWNSLFTTTLQSLNKMSSYSAEKGYKHYQGVSNILSAYTYSVLVDMWGDVPFSEALKGPEILQPVFDKGSDVYAGIHTLLDNGIATLGEADNGVTPGADDILFNGDVTQWIGFAHALKARLYLHTTKFDPTAAAKSLAEIAMANEASFVIQSPNTNPAYQFQENRNGDITYMSSKLFNDMVATGDNRIYSYVDTVNDALGPVFGSPNSPVYLISAMELKFIEAELLARTNDAGAAQAYADAITLSFDMVGDTSGMGAVMAAYPYDATETDMMLRIKPIMEQKYYAMFLQPESYSDWRRTGYPALTPTSGAAVPRRHLYPDTEKNSNKNTPTNLTIYDRVWWDK